MWYIPDLARPENSLFQSRLSFPNAKSFTYQSHALLSVVYIKLFSSVSSWPATWSVHHYMLILSKCTDLSYSENYIATDTAINTIHNSHCQFSVTFQQLNLSTKQQNLKILESLSSESRVIFSELKQSQHDEKKMDAPRTSTTAALLRACTHATTHCVSHMTIEWNMQICYTHAH